MLWNIVFFFRVGNFTAKQALQKMFGNINGKLNLYFFSCYLCTKNNISKLKTGNETCRLQNNT